MNESGPTTKSELLRRQRERRAHWEALIAAVPRQRAEEQGVQEDLSVKDIVAHLAAWEKQATERLRLVARGESPPPLPPPGSTWQEYEHGFNQRARKACRERSWETVRREADSSYAEFLSAAEAVPEQILFDSGRPAWHIVAFNGYLHYLDFADDLRRFVGAGDVSGSRVRP